jgi:hypothetical protein
VWAQRIDRSVRKHTPVPDHDDAIGQRVDVVHVVRREEDGDTSLAVKAFDESPHRRLGRGVESDRRLVEK